jgi:DNA-binding CsgD family transcriptional regulator
MMHGFRTPPDPPARSAAGVPDLGASFELLRTLIPFDAAQVLAIDGDTGASRPVEVFRTGYSSNTAWALAHMFPRKETLGFTRYASADAPLPPTISTSEVRGEFTSSRLFRDHLAQEGYADGMTLELFCGDEPVGLAHFSSRDPRAFDGAPRAAALAVSGLLGVLVAGVLGQHTGAGAAPGVRRHAQNDPEVERRLAADEAFTRHVAAFRTGPLAFVEHLWWVDGEAVTVEIVQPGNVTARPAPGGRPRGLTRQELQVLSALCCGASDADIAARLHLGVRTVQAYVSSLRNKLDAASRLEAVVIALGSGLYVPHPDTAPLHQIVRGTVTW